MKRLLVATIRVFPISSPTIAVKGKRGRGPGPLLVIFSSFLFFPNIPKIKWTKSEEKRNFRGRWVLGLLSSRAPTVPVPPPLFQKRGGAPGWVVGQTEGSVVQMIFFFWFVGMKPFRPVWTIAGPRDVGKGR